MFIEENLQLTKATQRRLENEMKEAERIGNLRLYKIAWSLLLLDQKLKGHFFICVLGYLLTMAVYTQARQKMNYRRNVTHLLDELNSIRLCSMIKKKGRKISYELEQMSPATSRLAYALGVTEQNVRSKINFSDYSL